VELKTRKLAGFVAAVILVTAGFGWWKSLHPASQTIAAGAESPTSRILSSQNRATDELTLPAAKSLATPVQSVEVCGFGRISADERQAAQAEAELDAKLSRDMRRWRDALLNSGDVRARAAGLFVADRFEANAMGKAPSQQSLDSLVQLERETNDPAIYAIALSACDAVKTPEPGGSCENITRRGWSKLEPDNAAPWLELAGAARAVNDTAAEDAAFAQAVNAGKIDDYAWSLFGFAEADMPADIGPFERSQLSNWMIGIEAAMSSPQLPASIASKHCTTENVKNDSVRSQCSQLAQLLVNRGTTLIDLAVGTSIGARTGWPEERVAALKEEKEALRGVWTQAEPEPGGVQSEFSCEAAVRRNQMLHESALLGELGAGREAIGLSGRTDAELAQSFHEYLEKMTRRAEQMNGR
jgi:hypothetical protein